jgi:hypothetical protein
MRIAIVLAAFVAATAVAAAAAPAPETSWGKAGVSYDQYRHDAALCQQTAMHVDLTRTEPVQALVLASRRIDAVAALDPYAVHEATIFARPDLRWREVRALLQLGLDTCLAEIGYTRFRLTDDQRAHLRHLSQRQPERQHYLHSLASDPVILAAQAIAPARGD